jgi:hypothetical protein
MVENAIRTFTVDMWWTDLNDVEIGLFRHSRHRAKSRQFTQDSDVIGEVLEDGERKGLISYREGLWKSEDPAGKRLVFKLFTPNMRWRATMDLLIGRSVQLSAGAGGFPVTAFSLNVDGHDQVIQVERSARKWPGLPEKFSFFLLTDGEAKFYSLRQDWINIGGDYTLYSQTGERVGHLNGRVIDIGGRWDVEIAEEHYSQVMAAALQLICAMIKFNGAARRHIAAVTDSVQCGAMKLALETQEAALYLNPRRPR